MPAIRFFLLLSILGSISTAAWGEQSWRILALRVDFPLETLDALSTTGTGGFDLSTFDQVEDRYQLPYDIPPHNRTYFENHLQALARYYRIVSDGAIEIDFAVYPQAQDEAYTLPDSALYYGNGRTTEEIEEKWLQLFEAAVHLAEMDPQGPAFAQFNSFLVFHAGVGHETGALNDVRSVYLSPQDLARIRPAGVTAASGAVKIPDFWILPEALSLGGVAGLNGVLAKFFGHQLGLPGLSNFADGLPGTGGWSLMDIGSNRLGFVLRDGKLDATFGYVAPHPMAWSKIRLGWIEPLVVERDTTVSLLATDRSGDLPKAIRIPLTANEYFLLENRQSRALQPVPTGVEPPFAEADEVAWIDPADIVFSQKEDRGVWLEVDEYDAFVPGSGVLIWHVDDAVINEKLAAGAINNDPAQQGIVLEEADGYRDIGNPLFDRIANIEGGITDPFFVGGKTLFNTATQPHSRTNAGLSSGVEIEVLAVPGDTMQVRIRFKKTAPAWPQTVVGGRVLQAADLDGDGAQELIIETATGIVLGTAAEGVATWGLAEARFLAAGDIDNDGIGELYVARGQQLSAWHMGAIQPFWEQTVDGNFDEALLTSGLALRASQPVLVLGGTALVLLDALNGQILRREEQHVAAMVLADTDGDGQLELIINGDGGGWRVTEALEAFWDDKTGEDFGALVSADLDNNGTSEILAVDAAGLYVWDRAGEQHYQRFGGVRAEDASGAVIGDVDDDGRLEIVSTGNRALYGWRANGLAQANFPITLPRFAAAGSLNLTPILADLNADGSQEIVLGTENGVYALNTSSGVLEGFPLLTAKPVHYTPVAADLDGDGQLELAALSTDAVYIWNTENIDTAYSGTYAAWGQMGFSAAQTYAQIQSVSMGNKGDGLLPASTVYCYPNPVGTSDMAHLRFTVARPAQIDMQVFDVLGERYTHKTLTITQTNANENEIVWSIDDYPSGLYLCRLEARANDGVKSVVVVKMAVSQ